MSHEPKPPKYRKSGGLYKITFPNKGAGKPTLTPQGLIRFPLRLQVKAWFGIKEFFLPFAENLNFKDVAEFTILPKNGALYLECSDKKQKIQTNLDANQALAIDLGTSANLMACLDTLGNSFLVDSRQAKAMNQLYNKRIAMLKQGKCRDYWDKACDRITLKRNNQMRDMVNKAARTTLEHCLTHGIGTIVVGWNQGIKDGANMGRHNNQQFVQMPLVKLKSRIVQLCELYGIRFVEMEQANTSAASFLDGDSLPLHGEKPQGWKASGKRVKRGLYRTKNKSLVNADLNGAANILQKVAGNLGIDLSRPSRRCLTTVSRIRIWACPKSNFV